MPIINKRELQIKNAINKISSTRYPIIIELAGMPRLGKTTFTDSLIDLFKRSGISTMLSSFATHSSPINDRWSFEFSAWTLFSFLKNYLELRQSVTKFIVADRGLFDSLVWLQLKADRGYSQMTTISTLRKMALMKPWGENICLVLAFIGETDLILQRHSQRRLYDNESLVSTEETLPRLRKAISSEVKTWISKGINVVLFDVGKESIEEMNSRAAEYVISSINQFAKRSCN